MKYFWSESEIEKNVSKQGSSLYFAVWDWFRLYIIFMMRSLKCDSKMTKHQLGENA